MGLERTAVVAPPAKGGQGAKEAEAPEPVKDTQKLP